MALIEEADCGGGGDVKSTAGDPADVFVTIAIDLLLTVR